jgi:hypothetical protein
MTTQTYQTTASFQRMNSFGGGGRAPIGGIYVVDVKGDEVFLSRRSVPSRRVLMQEDKS